MHLELRLLPVLALSRRDEALLDHLNESVLVDLLLADDLRERLDEATIHRIMLPFRIISAFYFSSRSKSKSFAERFPRRSRRRRSGSGAPRSSGCRFALRILSNGIDAFDPVRGDGDRRLARIRDRPDRRRLVARVVEILHAGALTAETREMRRFREGSRESRRGDLEIVGPGKRLDARRARGRGPS